MLSDIYNYTLVPWGVFGLFIFFTLLKFSAPYGKFNSNSWGPSISFKWGWIIQEITSPIVFSYFFLTGDLNLKLFSWVFFFLWNLHYFNRSIIFPVRQIQTSTCPLVIVVSAIFFNIVNGFINGYYFGSIASYEWSYINELNLIIGLIIFFGGAVINFKSDNILIRIKKKYNTYKIPNGFLYNYVSCPNYLGEIIQWLGFFIMTGSIPALLFLLWTIFNLVPRSISNHRWYLNNFPDYPKNRKAIIPFIL